MYVYIYNLQFYLLIDIHTLKETREMADSQAGVGVFYYTRE